mmetsp:Transcript_1807/g.3167  ORF Transcript_1807/g.3167 Transcript_1807/m.3167 type:complete len:96 (-) Transcript_1807:48-335(-)
MRETWKQEFAEKFPNQPTVHPQIQCLGSEEFEIEDQNESTESEDEFGSIERFEQIYECIPKESELYETLKDLKKQKNKNKRLPKKRRDHEELPEG